MIKTIVLATDGSASVERAIRVALDLADRFDATIHALFVVDESAITGAPESVQSALRHALVGSGEKAVAAVQEQAERAVVTDVKRGRPADEIRTYATAIDADVVVMGTRGRHGEHRYLLGSVTSRVVRSCPVPVLTVRHLAPDETNPIRDEPVT